MVGKASKNRRIVVYGDWSKTVNFITIEPESKKINTCYHQHQLIYFLDCCGWSTYPSSIYHFRYNHMVSLSKWEHYMMGGESDYHGTSTR